MKKKHPEPDKAYKNMEFINSPDARTIRILAEFLEPMQRFRKHNIYDTLVFFGSARTISPHDAQEKEHYDIRQASFSWRPVDLNHACVVTHIEKIMSAEILQHAIEAIIMACIDYSSRGSQLLLSTEALRVGWCL